MEPERSTEQHEPAGQPPIAGGSFWGGLAIGAVLVAALGVVVFLVNFTGSGLQGTWVCEGRCLYQRFEFRSGDNVVIHAMGIEFPTRYRRSEDRVYITTDKGDLGLRVVDATTLEGEGWASGTYRRQ